ncbi:ABC transporter substrate-binding protein [Vibrio marisflavi]|nr:ABC transporter substrate-binding protein [Vibrio marisflavi]
MDTKRTPIESHIKVADSIIEKVQNLKPDVVLLADDNALKLLGPELSKQNYPLVYYGINNNPRVYFEPERLPKNVYGVLERQLIIPLVRHLQIMLNTSKNHVLILFDDSNTSKSIINVALEGKSTSNAGKTNISWKMIGDFADWKKEIRNSDKHYDAIIVDTWFTVKDKNQKVLNEEYVLSWTGEHSPVPVFTMADYAVGNDKAIGAFVLNGYDQGKEAALIALQIINGEKPTRVKQIKSGTFYVNKEGFDKFGIKVPNRLKNFVIYR